MMDLASIIGTEAPPKGHKILFKEFFSEKVVCMRVEAAMIAKERKPGQFIIVQTDVEYGERIPLTIADADVEEGSITIVFQIMGKSTEELSHFEVGDYIPVITGPLGHPTHIENFGRVVAVGGGIGLAPLYPIVQGLKKAGNHVTVIAGARNKELLIFEEKMKAIADEYIVVTDDGSYGRKALVTEPLKEFCEQDPKPDMVIAIGPPVMMKFCAATTKPYGVYTLVSLNTIMIDGTGMCGCCRVTVDGKIKFVCVDGPEFNAHLVDFDNMVKRLASFREQETEANNHTCRFRAALKEMEEAQA